MAAASEGEECSEAISEDVEVLVVVGSEEEGTVAEWDSVKEVEAMAEEEVVVDMAEVEVTMAAMVEVAEEVMVVVEIMGGMAMVDTIIDLVAAVAWEEAGVMAIVREAEVNIITSKFIPLVLF